MEKYKLIKEYPGSPKLGTILKQLENDTIGAYPEYWEKIEELCVPIGTKFTACGGKLIYTISSKTKNKCTVIWGNGSVDYEISSVNNSFKTNSWEVYEEFSFECEDKVVNDPETWIYFVTHSLNRYKILAKKAANKVNNNFLYFSTEKAAKNYIKCHKPVLSYQEVLEIYDKNYVRPDRSKFKSELTKLVKGKLQ